MLQRLLVALFAATFALGAFAQSATPKPDTKAPTTATKKAEKKHAKAQKKHAKAEKKAKGETPK